MARSVAGQSPQSPRSCIGVGRGGGSVAWDRTLTTSPMPLPSPGSLVGRSAHVATESNAKPCRTLIHGFRCHSGEPHTGVPAPTLIRVPLPDGRSRKPIEGSQARIGLHPGRGLSLVGSATQPGRMSGSGGGLRRSSNATACWKPLGAPTYSSGLDDIVSRGENVLPVCAVSTNGGDSLTFPVSGIESSAKPGVSPADRAVCSGIGWTNAKHTIAMMVATVAHALTKDRLIPDPAMCKSSASRAREIGRFSAVSCCKSARSGDRARDRSFVWAEDTRPYGGAGVFGLRRGRNRGIAPAEPVPDGWKAPGAL